MSLKTGRTLHARQCTVLNATELVLDRVDQLAANEGINEMLDEEIIF